MSPTPDDDPTLVPLRSPPDGRPAARIGSGNALPLGTRLAEFEIKGLVGEGGFGIVYLAHDHVLGRDVALKEYMPSAIAARADGATVVVRAERYEEPFAAGLRSFINEARLLARFDHPSLVKVHRFWDENGTAYMVMPYYQGTTLKAFLKSRATAPDEPWLKALLADVADALDLLHADHCFHRDVAPDNIIILDGRVPLLLDFGAARRVIGDITHDLTAILKPGYAPVEQYAEGPSMKQGAWTDIYALASTVYFAIMGRAPEPSVARLIADRVIPLEQAAAGRYSAGFLRGIDQALSVRPQDRPQTMRDFCALVGLRPPRGRETSGAAATVDVDADKTTVAIAPGDTTVHNPVPAATTRVPTAPTAGATVPRPVAAAGANATTVQAARAAAPDEVTLLRPAPAPPGPRTRAAWPLTGLAVGVVAAAAASYFIFGGDRGGKAAVQEAAPAPVEAAKPAAVQAPPPPPSTTVAPVQRTEPIVPPAQTAPEPVGRAVAKSAPAPAKAPPAGAGPPAPPRVDKAECTGLIQRASLGEALTPAEQQALRNECR